MTADDVSSDVDYAALVDRYSDDASAEAIEAVGALHDLVDNAAVAGSESMDIGWEAYDIVTSLQAGDRVATVQAAMDLLDEESGEEAREAVDALERVYSDGEQVFNEVRDLADVLSDGAHEVSDGVAKIELPVDYFQDR